MNFIILASLIGLDPSAYYSGSMESVQTLKPSDYYSGYQVAVVTVPKPIQQPLPIQKPKAIKKDPFPDTSERQPGVYPTHAVQWHITGSAETRNELIEHLSHDGIHAGKFSRDWLDTLSRKQLMTLHDDDHRGVAMKSSQQPPSRQYVTALPPGAEYPGGPPVYVPPLPSRPQRPVVGCPGGVCPSPSRNLTAADRRALRRLERVRL